MHRPRAGSCARGDRDDRGRPRHRPDRCSERAHRGRCAVVDTHCETALKPLRQILRPLCSDAVVERLARTGDDREALLAPERDAGVDDPARIALHSCRRASSQPSEPYCSETRATVSKADAPANAKSAARPLTKGSGSGRSSSGAASIAAPAPITAAGQGRTGQATAAPTTSASAEITQAPNKIMRPSPERSDAARCSGGKWPLAARTVRATDSTSAMNSASAKTAWRGITMTARLVLLTRRRSPTLIYKTYIS